MLLGLLRKPFSFTDEERNVGLLLFLLSEPTIMGVLVLTEFAVESLLLSFSVSESLELLFP